MKNFVLKENTPNNESKRIEMTHLESGNHNSCVSKFESSVSVELAECG